MERQRETSMKEDRIKPEKEVYVSAKGQEDKRRGRGVASLSVWALLARSSIYRILTALLLVAAAQWGIYSGMLYRAETSGGMESLERMLNVTAWPGFLILLGTVYGILALTQGRMDDKSSCTLMRLQVGRSRMFGIRTAYNVLCLTLVFAAQATLAIGMVGLYGQAAGRADILSQTLFLVFYQNRFLHCLLPMAETGKWVRNVLLVLALGMEAAGGAGKKRAVMQTALFAAAAGWFVSYIGVNVPDVLCDALCSTCIAVNLCRAGVFRKTGKTGTIQAHET